MRDAMILTTHVRNQRDVFMSNDTKAFGAEGSVQRQRVEKVAHTTRIMTLAEFARFCQQAPPDDGTPGPT